VGGTRPLQHHHAICPPVKEAAVVWVLLLSWRMTSLSFWPSSALQKSVKGTRSPQNHQHALYPPVGQVSSSLKEAAMVWMLLLPWRMTSLSFWPSSAFELEEALTVQAGQKSWGVLDEGRGQVCLVQGHLWKKIINWQMLYKQPSENKTIDYWVSTTEHLQNNFVK